jgi:enoyl-[acyl-carrier protein] reductase II
VALSVLLPQVVDAVGDKVPVVAAGGIYDGRGLAASLALGASGVWCGTRFMMTPESTTHPEYKTQLLKAGTDDTTVTTCFTGYPLRAVKNAYTQHFVENPDELAASGQQQTVRSTKDGVWALHGGVEGELDTSALDYDKQAYVTGQCIGAIDKLIPAGEIVRSMAQDAIQIFQQTQARHFSIEGGGDEHSRL